jgi:branched-chain amino acid transport system permease protein
MPEVPKDFAVYLEEDRAMADREIRPRITPAIVDEHRRDPFGKHSDALRVVLHYLRKNHLLVDGKAVVICTRRDEEWCLGELTGVRGQPPRIERSMTYRSRGEAEHAVFRKRLHALGLWEE